MMIVMGKMTKKWKKEEEKGGFQEKASKWIVPLFSSVVVVLLSFVRFLSLN